MDQQITPSTAEQLFSVWTDGPPRDSLLLYRAKMLSRMVCRRVSADLADRTSPEWWSLARDYRKAVSFLNMACVDLEDILYSTFPAWRSWTSWNPDILRLQAWTSIKSPEPFGFLRAIDGPPIDDHSHGTEWKALIRKGELLSWLSSRFTLGPGLITDDSEQHLATYVKQLLDTVVAALKRGSVYSGLLRILVDSQGLDWQPLKIWNGLVSIIPAEFIELIVTTQTKEDSDIVLLRGLHALSLDTAEDCRRALVHQISTCVNRVVENTQSSFLARFASGQLWLPNAKRLWTLRETINKAEWIHQHLSENLLNAVKSQNTTRIALPRMNELQRAVNSNPSLEASVDVYVQRFVLDGSVTNDHTTTMPKVLHTLFCCTERADIRDTGITLASINGFDAANRTQCIKQLLSLPTEMVHRLHECLLLLPGREHTNFVALTSLIKAVHRTLNLVTTCYGNLLQWTFEAYDFRLSCSGFTSLGFKAYAEWIAELNEASNLEGVQSIHARLLTFKDLETVVESLELCSAKRVNVSKLVLDASEHALESYRHMFQCLSQHANSARRELLYSIILANDFYSSHAEALCGTVCGVTALPEDGFSACQELFELHRSDEHLAYSRLNVWLRMSRFDGTTARVLGDLADTLKIKVLYEDSHLSANSIEVLRSYYQCRIAKMRESARRLETSKKALKKVDPDSVVSMVTELDIEQLTPAADVIADLPEKLADFVDDTAEDIVELHFPLSAPTLSTMERLVYGFKGSDTLLVHLDIDVKDEIAGFCVHVEDNEPDQCDEHSFTVLETASAPPDRLTCRGRQTRLTYIISRLIWRQLREERTSLQGVYEGIQQFLHRGALQCMVCFDPLDVSLHRPTICSKFECSMVYRKSHLDVRLEDLRTDGRVVDLLLSSIYAASSIGTLELLPNKPSALGTPPEVVKLLNSMPDTTTLAMDNYDQSHLDEQTESFFSWLSESFPGFIGRPRSKPLASELSLSTLNTMRKNQTELLLSWLCGSQRGFVVSATDRYRIPIFANVQQFLLVDAPPEVEAAFAKHNDLTPRNILFHGTSMDRLYSVLCQGLRVLSGTGLQVSRGRMFTHLIADPLSTETRRSLRTRHLLRSRAIARNQLLVKNSRRHQRNLFRLKR